MPARNTAQQYGWVSIVMHWLMVPVVLGLFGLGWWMTQLSYYDPWYRQGPEIHKAVGILLMAVLLFRLLWKITSARPQEISGTPRWQARAAHIAHGALYALLLAIGISGYLISTADGRAIEVFNWFSVPATLQGIANQEDLAGDIHEILAWTLVGLVALHALAALKHHFFNRDETLRRMLGLKSRPSESGESDHPLQTQNI